METGNYLRMNNSIKIRISVLLLMNKFLAVVSIGYRNILDYCKLDN